MTEERLSEIKARADMATIGNWRATLDDPYDRTYVLGAFNGTVAVIADIKGDADAEFIANARHDVPELVAEVERLQKAFYSARQMEIAQAVYNEKQKQENARLRKALEFYAEESNHIETRGNRVFGDVFYDKGRIAKEALSHGK